MATNLTQHFSCATILTPLQIYGILMIQLELKQMLYVHPTLLILDANVKGTINVRVDVAQNLSIYAII